MNTIEERKTTIPVQQPVKSLPQLQKGSSIYKLIVPEKVEEKIRYLLRKFPSTEWSGVLFYTHQGSFEKGDLVVTCEDIFPMDLGNATYTEFSMSEDVAAYMADNIELFDCNNGLVHSHHCMTTTFSGTDMETLQTEGNDTNCFVSLIVNNEGTYSAKITRKVQSKSEVIVKNLGTSYEFFGDGTKDVKKKDTETKKVIDKEVIEYFDLKVERHEVHNSFSYLDDRFEEIEKKKVQLRQRNVSQGHWLNDDRSFFDVLHQKNNEEPNLFSNEEDSKKPFTKNLVTKEEDELYDDALDDWEPDASKVHAAVVHLVTCSLILDPSRFDMRQWTSRHMINMYKKIFGEYCEDEVRTESLGAFSEWRDFIVQHTLDYFDYGESKVRIMDNLDIVQSKLAQAIIDELSEYTIIGKGTKIEEDNIFIQSYIDAFACYLIE